MRILQNAVRNQERARTQPGMLLLTPVLMLI